MKRLSTIIMALVLALGLTQCKKNEPTADNQGEIYNITLNVSGASSSANKGEKVDVNPITGSVDFETGDKIHVASAGKYVGMLTYNGTEFTGAIGNATEGLPLQFYFLGNVDPAETLSIGTSESCSVVISDQTTHLPLISAAPSVENFYGNVTEYTAELKNKCALVKFNVTTSSEAPTCIAGFNNKVTIDFAENTITNSMEDDGSITLSAGSGEKWAILLPQSSMTGGEAYASGDEYAGTFGAVPAIYVNGYFPAGIPVEVTTAQLPQGAIGGLFSVSATQQVYFSKGNLQYIGSAGTPYWQFAEHQYDYLGNNGQGSDSQTADRDLFGWGTSGYNHGANCYQPWSTSQNNADYYAYSNSTYHLYDDSGQADWGYNVISNGGNQENSGWRTLTQSEWDYVFNTRSTTSGIRWAKGTVNGVNGTILLPDNWTESIYALNNTNGGNYSSNTISAEDWVNVLEANGAVFLSVAGSRSGSSVSSVGSDGYYWSSSESISSRSYVVGFSSNYLSSTDRIFRYTGLSVRLVRNA